jgi:3-hydroxyacyl-CoA dehydrogenase
VQAALARQVARGRVAAADAQTLLGRIAVAEDDAALAGCTIGIESVPEDRALKTAVLRRLEARLPADAVIASNTSGLPIDGLADALRDPSRLLGLHFFSPVERMPLVEVVRGARTGDAPLARALAWVRAIGQQPVVVRDGPGFFTSRVFAAYLDEAVAMVGEGVDAARIEAAGLALGRSLGTAGGDGRGLAHAQPAAGAPGRGRWPAAAVPPLARQAGAGGHGGCRSPRSAPGRWLSRRRRWRRPHALARSGGAVCSGPAPA